MVDTAARLVVDVLPRVRVRQWVLSFPYEMRYHLAYDGELLPTVLAVIDTIRRGRRWLLDNYSSIGELLDAIRGMWQMDAREYLTARYG